MGPRREEFLAAASLWLLLEGCCGEEEGWGRGGRSLRAVSCYHEGKEQMVCGGCEEEEGKRTVELGHGRTIWPLDGLLGHCEVHK